MEKWKNDKKKKKKKVIEPNLLTLPGEREGQKNDSVQRKAL